MSALSRLGRLSVAAAMIALCSAAVVDRIAIVVGNSVITQSEVLQDVRITELLNRQPLDLGPAARRAAADRLVDQQLIRNEIITGRYAMPTDDESAAMLRNFRQEDYPNDAAFHAALQKYGITEDDLKHYFLWQLAVLRFTEARFQTGLPGEPVQSANRIKSGAAVPVPNDVDRQLEAWLKETRSNTRVQFKPGAFQ